MKCLLDTHIFYWLLLDSPRLNNKLRRTIEAATTVYISSVSVWEIAIKSQLGKLNGDPEDFYNAIATFGFEELAVSGRHALLAAKLPPLHKDPFDRLLVAQAMHEGFHFYTADEILAGYSDRVKLV